MTTRVGSVLASKYRLDEELGRGGMGAVYRAFHLLVRKEFAIKVLTAEGAVSKELGARFQLEAQAAGRIGHPGILEVYDLGEDDEGSPFIVMELLRGEPLSALVKRGPVDVDTAVWIATEVLDVLEAAHAAGVVHRDVKPQNVFLVEAPGGRRTVKLLDFGIAKFHDRDGATLTRSGQIIGSPLYMAPEQARGESEIDARVDVWSVGAMLFEMLTGRAAHVASTPIAVLAKVLTEPAPPPSSSRPAVPSALDAAVERALRIDREERFPSARAFADALRATRPQPDATPVFAAIPAGAGERATPAPVDPEAATSTATEAAPAGTSSAAEPPLEAAVTQAAETKRAKPLLAALALVVVLVAAASPWLVPSWRGTPVSATSSALGGAGSVPPVVTEAEPPPPPAVAASTSAPAGSAAPSASPAASGAPARPIAPEAGSPPARATAPLSKPACSAGEVLSAGHCCPRGLVWQSGRCERPLATSF